MALVDEFVGRLPDGYGTNVGEGGGRLSGGQRRRLALARAVVRESSSLLLLDEPTSGLDTESEATVLAALRRVIRGRTAIIVSHDPGVAALADRVVVLDQGRIAEERRPQTVERTGIGAASRGKGGDREMTWLFKKHRHHRRKKKKH